MSLLVSLLFLLLSMLYVLTVHSRTHSLAPYISGIIVGIGAIPASLLLKFNFYTSSNVLLNAFSYFSFYFIVPATVGFFLYFLCNLKSFEVKTLSLALQGIWTVFLFFASYEMAKVPDSAIYFILFLTYFLIFLFFDFLLHNSKIQKDFSLFIISYCFAMLIAFFACFCFELWLYKYSPFVYLGLPAILDCLLFCAILISREQKKKEKGEIHSLLDGNNR